MMRAGKGRLRAKVSPATPAPAMRISTAPVASGAGWVSMAVSPVEPVRGGPGPKWELV
jgi:hypothetical protein